ncbi:MAG: SLC13 family permease [Planctomycetaceae bacterium]
MIDPASWTLLIVALVIVALARLRTSPDLILLGGLVLLLAGGAFAETKNALLGFANEGLVTIAALFVVVEGFRQTGGLGSTGQALLGQPRNLLLAQARMMLPVSLASAFLNNTPVVAMALPVVRDWAHKHGLAISRLLLPLSYSAILGGLCTLVGTSTTLVINGLMIDSSRPDLRGKGYGLGMFDIAWVGIPVAVVGLVYILVCSRWWLPDRRPAIATADDPREYTVEMLVAAGSPLVGRSIKAAGLRNLPGMYLMEISRGDRVLPAVASEQVLEADDRLVFVGIVESVVDLQKIAGLEPATDQVFQLDGPRTERCLVEAVVSDSCPMIHRTIRDGRFRSHYAAAVIAVARHGTRINAKIGDIRLRPGDTLLLEAHPRFLRQQRNRRDFYLVSAIDDFSPPRHHRAWVARGILLAMVFTVAMEWVSMLLAALVASFAMLASGCLSGNEARQSINWSVVLAIGAGLGIGQAMHDSHAAERVANLLFGAAETAYGLIVDSIVNHPRAMLALVAALSLVLTNIITAKAAAVLMFPIAVAAADSVGASAFPFVVAVAVTSAASLATPVGFQTNLMVYGPGGYRFGDYLRFGGLLSVIVWAVTVVVVPWAWPLVAATVG